MPDDRTNSAVVDGIVGIGEEKWRLQNSRWKDNLVHLWIVISVHGRRGHAPVSPINRLADFV